MTAAGGDDGVANGNIDHAQPIAGKNPENISPGFGDHIFRIAQGAQDQRIGDEGHRNDKADDRRLKNRKNNDAGIAGPVPAFEIACCQWQRTLQKAECGDIEKHKG